MKKTLIALAAVAATSTAFAQSTVTLYGVADASLGKQTDKSAALAANGVMNNGSSRLGVRGSEDLGGGLKATFNFEQGINIGNGATDVVRNSSGVITANTTFARAATVGLSGGFGAVNLGRRLTPSFFGVAAWELTGTANYSVVANQFSFAGAGSRNDNEISYTTPSFGGFTATLGTVLKGNRTDGESKIDLNAIYRAGPLTAALSYNKIGSAKNTAIGAKYNFGGFAVAGSLQDPNGNAKGFTLGASTAFGPVNLVLDIARDTFAKDTDVLLEAKYSLSKRTTAYAALLNDGDNKRAATASKSNLGLGIRHNF